MVVRDKKEFLIYLKYLKLLGFGSEGIAYYDKKKSCFKSVS